LRLNLAAQSSCAAVLAVNPPKKTANALAIAAETLGFFPMAWRNNSEKQKPKQRKTANKNSERAVNV
jgi:hypothetical protein